MKNKVAAMIIVFAATNSALAIAQTIDDMQSDVKARADARDTVTTTEDETLGRTAAEIMEEMKAEAQARIDARPEVKIECQDAYDQVQERALKFWERGYKETALRILARPPSIANCVLEKIGH